jgi:hypothetical protein
MSTQLTRLLSPSVGLAVVAGLALAACNRGEAPKSASVAAAANPTSANATAEMSWARAALGRNPDLEVIATDPQSGVVTVKHRSTGQVEAIKASELAAVTPSQLKPMEMQAAPPPEPEPAPSQNESARAPSQTAQATAPDTGANQPGTITTNGAYTVDRSGGKLRVSGPGVSIESSGTGAAASNQPGAGRRAVDPFICEGRRQLQLDNRDIYVDGDAITVRGGCEVFITNSHVVATGTGIIVQDGVVHVSNSQIEGGNASFQADDRAKMYVRGSTFTGVPRRAELAMVQDQGGNRYR